MAVALLTIAASVLHYLIQREDQTGPWSKPAVMEHFVHLLRVEAVALAIVAALPMPGLLEYSAIISLSHDEQVWKEHAIACHTDGQGLCHITSYCVVTCPRIGA